MQGRPALWTTPPDQVPASGVSAKARAAVPGAGLRLGSAGMRLLGVLAPLSAGSPCSLPSVLAREVPEVRKLSSSTAPSRGAQAPPAFSLPRFFPFSLTRLHGGLSFSAGYLRSSCSQLVFCENCSSFKCSFDVFVGGVNSVFFYFKVKLTLMVPRVSLCSY